MSIYAELSKSILQQYQQIKLHISSIIVTEKCRQTISICVK